MYHHVPHAFLLYVTARRRTRRPKQPATSNQQPTISTQQSANSNHQSVSAVSNQHSAISNQQTLHDTQRPRQRAPKHDYHTKQAMSIQYERHTVTADTFPAAAMSLHVRSLRLVAVRRIRIRIFRHALVYRKQPSVYRYTSDHSSTRTTHRGRGSGRKQ